MVGPPTLGVDARGGIEEVCSTVIGAIRQFGAIPEVYIVDKDDREMSLNAHGALGGEANGCREDSLAALYAPFATGAQVGSAIEEVDGSSSDHWDLGSDSHSGFARRPHHGGDYYSNKRVSMGIFGIFTDR